MHELLNSSQTVHSSVDSLGSAIPSKTNEAQGGFMEIFAGQSRGWGIGWHEDCGVQGDLSRGFRY